MKPVLFTFAAERFKEPTTMRLILLFLTPILWGQPVHLAAQSETRPPLVLLSRHQAERTPPEDKPLALLTPKDSLMLTVREGKKFLAHPVKAGQTLYALTKFYGLGLEELYEHNPAFRTDPTLRIGSWVTIPVPNRAIIRFKTEKYSPKFCTPIYYIVQDRDNLFQISKRYFEMPVDSVLQHNKLKDNNIHPGQRLLVGWLPTSGIPVSWRPVRKYSLSNALKERYEEDKDKRKEVVSQGVCFWQKDSKEKGDLYALHREAALGSIIAVTNPMYDATVYAKVIGRIPAGYKPNIEIVLSPEAARKIGAKDPKFFVKLKFLK